MNVKARIVIPLILALRFALGTIVYAKTTCFYLIRGASSSSSSIATK